jgi:hypothetical protein
VEAPHIPWLFSYFVMTAPGRVAYHRPPTPVVQKLVSTWLSSPIRKVSENDIKASLKRRFREFSQFEQQLFAMNRLRQEGELALTLIGTISLIEAFLKGCFPPPPIRRVYLYDYLEKSVWPDLSSIISKTDKEILLRANTIRNKAVHELISERQSLTRIDSQMSPGRMAIDDGSIIDCKIVTESIATTFRIFRDVNVHLSKRKRVIK